MTSLFERPIAVIEAPSNLGLRPPREGIEPGTKYAPGSLSEAGLYGRLKPSAHYRVEPSPYPFGVRDESGVRHSREITKFSRELADILGRTLTSSREFPLVIGGDCSVLIGVALALKRIGKFGLLFVDGHTDFYLPEQSPTGGAAGLDLAIVTGWGPSCLTDMDGLRPYIDAERVMLLGNRGDEPADDAPIPTPARAGMEHWPLARFRANSKPELQAAVNQRFRDVEGVWMHIDVDVLDSSIMPAVDSPQPDGLSWEELGSIVRSAFESNRVSGIDICIFDPSLDADQKLSRELADNIASWFSAVV